MHMSETDASGAGNPPVKKNSREELIDLVRFLVSTDQEVERLYAELSGTGDHELERVILYLMVTEGKTDINELFSLLKAREPEGE
jgi:hypothetical protein